MDNIIIYGAGQNAKKIINTLVTKRIKNRIQCFVDENRTGEIDGIRIESVSYLDYVSRETPIVISIGNHIISQEIVIKLYRMNFTNVYLYNDLTYFSILNEDGTEGLGIRKYFDVKPILNYVEFHVSDKCNMNCKGCAHFSNLVDEDIFPTVLEFEEMLLKLRQRFRGIGAIRLLGGEPLLNPQLDKYIRVARKIYPTSRIAVVTNGLLIRKITEEVLKELRENQCFLDITWYEPCTEKLPDSIAFLNENEIQYSVTPKVDNFYVNLTKSDNYYMDAYYNLDSPSSECRCHTIRKGRLTMCSRIPYAYENKEFLGLDFTQEDYDKSTINLDSDITGWDILNKISQPVRMCRMCSSHKCIKWEKSREVLAEDWFV